MAENGSKAWTLANTVMAGMSALIVALLCLGFNAIQGQVRDGDTGIHAELVEIKSQHKVSIDRLTDRLVDLVKDIAVLKTNQETRLQRERIESEGGTRGRIR